MKIADALDEIRTRNARIERDEKGGGVEEALAGVRDQVEEKRLRAEREDEDMARRAFEEYNRESILCEEAEREQTTGGNQEVDNDADCVSMPPPTSERMKKAKKALVPDLAKGQNQASLPLFLLRCWDWLVMIQIQIDGLVR